MIEAFPSGLMRDELTSEEQLFNTDLGGCRSKPILYNLHASNTHLV
jgi:hypothetical protein